MGQKLHLRGLWMLEFSAIVKNNFEFESWFWRKIGDAKIFAKRIKTVCISSCSNTMNIYYIFFVFAFVYLVFFSYKIKKKNSKF